MHAELQAFFTANAAATCDCKRVAHEQMAPMMQSGAAIVAHLHDLKHKLTLAELAPHDHALDGKFEWMHTRLDAGIVRVAEWLRSGRDLAKVLVEVDQGFTQDVINLNAMLQVKGADGTVARIFPAPPSVPSVAEVVSSDID